MNHGNPALDLTNDDRKKLNGGIELVINKGAELNTLLQEILDDLANYSKGS